MWLNCVKIFAFCTALRKNQSVESKHLKRILILFNSSSTRQMNIAKKETITMPDKIERSSGSIFTDLSSDDAVQMLTKANPASFIIDVSERHGLTQNQAAQLLGAGRSDISRLKRGHDLQRFTFDGLFGRMNKLGRNIALTPKSKKRSEEVARIQVVGF